MEITEVRIKLMEDPGERLLAFCSITFDNCFVIRDLKIIEGTNGPFVAMPSRKLTAHCPQCGTKNHLRAGYCNHCGLRLNSDRVVKDEDGRAKLYADIAHPINSACREMIQDRVIRSYREEQERAKLPGYVSSYDDFDDDFVAQPHHGGPNRPHARMETSRPSAGSHESNSATQQPRGPHRAVPSNKPTAANPPASPPANRPQNPGFGQGIF